MPRSKSPGDRRKAPRAATTIAGVAKTGQGARHPLEIIDLSVGGCAVRSNGHPLAIGSAYGLKINGLEMLGSTATWTAGQTAGLVFENPLHPAVADHIALLHPRPAAEPATREADA